MREKCQARNPYPQIEFLTGNGKKEEEEGKKITFYRKPDLSLPTEDF